MARATADLSKITGVASLGILTGATGALAYLSQPSLSTLPAFTPSPSTFRTLRAMIEARLTSLSNISLGALLTAFIMAPRGTRQPYVLWSSLPILGITGHRWWMDRQERLFERHQVRAGLVGTPETGSESEEWEVEKGESSMAASTRAEVNGEMVREEIEAWGRGMQWRAMAFGAGMMSGLVGLLGDMF